MNIWLDPQEQLVLGWDFLLRVNPVVQVDPGDTAICMDFYATKLLKVGSEGFLTKLLQVKIDLVPAVVQFQRHRTEEWLYPRDGLKITALECPSDVFVIKHVHLETKVFIKLSDVIFLRF